MLPNGDAETELARDGMCEVRETRKGDWWQVHGRSAAVVTCAAVVPSVECVGCHRPEELGHQMLRPADVVSVWDLPTSDNASSKSFADHSRHQPTTTTSEICAARGSRDMNHVNHVTTNIT